MSDALEVRVRGGVSRHVFLCILLSIFLGATALVTVVFWPNFVEVLTGQQSLNISVLLYPLMIFVIVGFTIFVALQVRGGWDPIVFTQNHFNRHSSSHTYDYISRVYLNPEEDYIVLLFREPLGESRTPGIDIQKDRIEPSLEALVGFLSEQGIVIERTRPFLDSNLLEIQKRLWKGGDKAY